MPVERQCSLFRTKPVPYCLYFRSLSYKDGNNCLNENQQGTCTGNSTTNTGQTRRRPENTMLPLPHRTGSLPHSRSHWATAQAPWKLAKWEERISRRYFCKSIGSSVLLLANQKKIIAQTCLMHDSMQNPFTYNFISWNHPNKAGGRDKSLTSAARL